MNSLMSIADLFDFKKGKKPGELFDFCPNEGKPFLQIDHLRGQGKKIFTVDNRATEVNISDICIVWDGANAGLVGYGLEGYIGSTITRLRPKKKDCIHVPFVAKYLQSKFSYINKSAQGAAIPHVDGYKLKNLTLFLPSLIEQKRIAAILDKADEVRRKRQQAIELSEQLLRSVFLDMFGDPVSKNWKLTTVEKIAADRKGSIRTGPFGSQLLHSEFTSSGVSVLGIDNAVKNVFQWAKPRYISEEKYTKLKRYTVYPEDLIITIMGTCGRAAIVPDNCPRAINTKHLCCITLDKNVCTPEYVHSYFLMHKGSLDYLARSAKGAIMDGLNMGIIKELPIYLPPLSLQTKYSHFYKKLFSDQKKLVASSNIAQELFNSLSQKAFNGELSKHLEKDFA
ncbi:TPA: restriction endonuclease subunit S [Legionella pneumophila]